MMDPDPSVGPGEEDPLRFLYDTLRRAFEEIGEFHGRLPGGLSASSAFAVGEALGLLSKAKSQVGRDLDERAEAKA